MQKRNILPRTRSSDCDISPLGPDTPGPSSAAHRCRQPRGWQTSASTGSHWLSESYDNLLGSSMWDVCWVWRVCANMHVMYLFVQKCWVTSTATNKNTRAVTSSRSQNVHDFSFEFSSHHSTEKQTYNEPGDWPTQPQLVGWSKREAEKDVEKLAAQHAMDSIIRSTMWKLTSQKQHMKKRRMVLW